MVLFGHMPQGRASALQIPEPRLLGTLVAEASSARFHTRLHVQSAFPPPCLTPRVHAQGYIDAMSCQNVMSRLARGLIRGSRADRKREDGISGDMGSRSRSIRERATRAFSCCQEIHTKSVDRLGSLGEGRRAERPLKIRNGHVEQGQAKPGPGQQQRGKTSTCFGRQEREP